MNQPKRRDAQGTRERLLRAAEYLFLRRGYAATTVDEICSRAGATKGAFFHHFKNKQHLGLECAKDHAARRMELLNRATEKRPAEPVGRLFDYLDHLVDLSLRADMPACLIGVLTVELAAVNEDFRVMCDEHLGNWQGIMRDLIADALSETGRPGDAEALSKHALSTIQGSMVLAKASGDAQIIADSVGQLRSHLATVVGATA